MRVAAEAVSTGANGASSARATRQAERPKALPATITPERELPRLEQDIECFPVALSPCKLVAKIEAKCTRTLHTSPLATERAARDT